jgi:hypothetical protein
MKTGRPRNLSDADERRAYVMHLSGDSIATCAGFMRVSTATMKRAFSRQRKRYAHLEPLARELRAKLEAALELG